MPIRSQGGCYPPRSKTDEDNTIRGFHNWDSNKTEESKTRDNELPHSLLSKIIIQKNSYFQNMLTSISSTAKQVKFFAIFSSSNKTAEVTDSLPQGFLVVVASSGDSLHYTNDILTDIDRYVFLTITLQKCIWHFGSKIPYNWVKKKFLRFRGTLTSSWDCIIFPAIDKIQIYFIFIGKR